MWRYGNAPNASHKSSCLPSVVRGQKLYHFRGDGHVEEVLPCEVILQLLVFAGKQPKAGRIAELAELAAKTESESGGLIRARLLCLPEVGGLATSFIDREGEAHQYYGARHECLYLIRPDAYVAFRSQQAAYGPLQGFLKRIFM